MLYILCICSCPVSLDCIFRLPFQVTQSLENLSISVVFWTGSEFTISTGQVLLRKKKSCFKANKSIQPEGIVT